MGAPEKSTVLPGFMPNRLPEGARPPQDFKPIDVAKELLRTTRSGALATLDRNTGHPFCSLVNVATDIDGSPLILVSQLSTHTANIEVDQRASVLLASTGKGDPLAHPRLTVLGAFEKIERKSADEGRVVRRYGAKHPKSDMYASFADFADPDGKFNLSALDVQAEFLIVSQFTLYADVRKGRRPSFTDAARPELAAPSCDQFVARLRELGFKVETGEFQAMMEVEIHNTGPVTIWIDTADLSRAK